METIRSCCEQWRPEFAMVAVVVAFAVMNILVKRSFDDGLNPLVFITVRQLIATVCLAPIAYFRERKTRPKLTRWIVFQLFISALLGGFLNQYLYFIGLRYTSATFSCAFLNMAPVFTFLIALPFRLEQVNLRNKAGKAKILATVICTGGAMVLMFYKGIALTTTAVNQLHRDTAANNNRKALDWTIGSVCLLIAIISLSAWFLVQAKIGKNYPALCSSTTIMFFLSFLQATVLVLAAHQNKVSLWLTLKGKMEVITVLYTGVVCSGLGFLVMSWCVSKRGPLFTAAFNPLIQVIVAFIEYFLVRQAPHLGSVLGSTLVILGLYILLWGKSKERAFESLVVEPIREGEKGVDGQSEPV